MSLSRKKIAVSLSIILLIGLALVQGCGQITGEFSANQPPIVEIVNVPPDASGTSVTKHQGMPFLLEPLGSPTTILSMQGAVMDPDSAIRVYDLIPDTTFTPTDTVIVFNEELFVEGTDYTMDRPTGTLTALAGGSMAAGETYYIDFCFSVDNYYVFSYAPIIHWSGYDPDGFVDHYSFADVTDTTFINEFDNASDQNAYAVTNIAADMWIDTTAMEARIYLLTAEGDTTEHLFFVKATDNLGAQSNMDVKTFFRSNNAPYNPQIKPLEAPDADYTQHYFVEDTLFCLDDLDPPWDGISFNWTAEDPDEKELIQIPLEYSYYLVKTPGDTIWQNGASDSAWSETQQIQLFGLETGSYTFSVWVRDDGFTVSAEPAMITFTAVRPTFEHHILIVDESILTSPSWGFELPQSNIDDPLNFYLELLGDMEGQLDYDNYVMDGVDVRVLNNRDAIALAGSPIPYSLIGQYRLVLMLDDDHSAADVIYRANRNTVLADYMDIGGSVWIEGRSVLVGSFGYSDSPEGNDINSSGTQPRILGDYFQLLFGFGAKAEKTFILPPPFPPPDQANEFTGAVSTMGGLPDIEIDTSKTNVLANPPGQPDGTLIDIDWFTISDEAQSIYIYNSITADTNATSQYVNGDTSAVQENATPVQCVVMPQNDGLLEVYRVENITKGIVGEVISFNSTSITVSQPYGAPWDSTDFVEVDYKYDPVSEYHLKPVASRYENQQRTLVTVELTPGVFISTYQYSLGYRNAIFTFPLYFMENENGEVEDVFREMLNWFFYPTIHWIIN
ncbi:hypothetical protein CEE37_01225 [candidate division LCP-89 bacterium B3_LCP]|uniref:Uncharacterized protein n=1 Tax=candidate division LCP-89 bacterium B3_LCP TaxID=2012998 RepID=A0A532V571_UNCL8|nr:MAG: hypothetical protein CEE37_01225 [candidate division LCP-89 bacterium B3_LCP]